MVNNKVDLYTDSSEIRRFIYEKYLFSRNAPGFSYQNDDSLMIDNPMHCFSYLPKDVIRCLEENDEILEDSTEYVIRDRDGRYLAARLDNVFLTDEELIDNIIKKRSFGF